MTVVNASIEIEATPEEVWAVVSDPRNLPRWDRHVTKVVGVPKEGLEEGTEYTTIMSFMGVRAHVDAEVLEIKPPEHSRIRLSGPVLEAVVTSHVTRLDGDRTLLEHVVDYEMRGGFIGRIAERALDATGGPAMMLRRGTLGQKQQIEEG
ncbi:MAG: SRPBCC family protein [Actinomycetota bacterium]